MKKLSDNIGFILLGFVLVLGFLAGWLTRPQYSDAATILTTTNTDTIGTFRTNVNTSLTNLNEAISASTSSLGSLAGLSTTTGNMVVASSNVWTTKSVGANGKCLTASSTAAGGINWETCPGFTDAGTSTSPGTFTVSTSSSKVTITIPPAHDEFYAPSSTISTGANPTATIGRTATNGSANTFLRSDGAPALAPQFASSSFAMTMFDATNTQAYAYFLLLAPDYNFTLSKFSCQNSVATTTYNVFTTSTSAVATSGTAMASLVCGVNATSTTSFTTSTVPAGSYMIAQVSSTVGTPTRDELWFNGLKQ